jgi:hypothetical protein
LTNQSYGNATDLWGSTWTPADINNAGFGAVLSVFNTRSLGAATATVNFMQITVTYTIPGSLQWYTASSGGAAIGSGSTFNPVGVANSGLANTNTAGTTSYYVACSTAVGSCRAKADFVINALPTATISGTTSVCNGSTAPNVTFTGAAGTANQGYAGGDGFEGPGANARNSGGGGGAGSVGTNADASVAGNGGSGITTSISGTSTVYAGGGGGGVGYGTRGTGTDGGGNGGNGSTAGVAGTANRGAGGGGGGRNESTGTTQSPGAGGSGIVIVRYAR